MSKIDFTREYQKAIAEERYSDAAHLLIQAVLGGLSTGAHVHKRVLEMISPPAGGPSDEAVQAALDNLKASLESPAFAEALENVHEYIDQKNAEILAETQQEN